MALIQYSTGPISPSRPPITSHTGSAHARRATVYARDANAVRQPLQTRSAGTRSASGTRARQRHSKSSGRVLMVLSSAARRTRFKSRDERTTVGFKILHCQPLNRSVRSAQRPSARDPLILVRLCRKQSQRRSEAPKAAERVQEAAPADAVDAAWPPRRPRATSRSLADESHPSC